MTGGAWRLGRRPGLDGLRGIAILLVLVDHSLALVSGRSFTTLGTAGVEVFFALSGFLITALLLDEWADRGRVSLTAFYVRRARRLLPALTLLLLTLLVLRPWVTVVDLAPNVWPTVLYMANWARIEGQGLGALNPTWSLAVEEQFYLVWPVLLLLVIRWRRGPLFLVTLGIALSTVLRFVLGSGVRVHDGSDTQAGALLAGALLAIVLHRGLPPWRANPWLVGVVGAGMFAWASFESPWASSVLVPTIVPVVTAGMIWAICSVPGGPFEWSSLRYVGRRSYAVYLWHTPMAWLAEIVLGVSFGAVAMSVVATFAVAELSWRLVERPFLGVRSRREGPPPAAEPSSPGSPGAARMQGRSISVEPSQS